RWRKRIKDNRCAIVDKVFKTNIALASIVENKACGSDIKDSPADALPVTQIPDWCSDELTTILHCLDKMVIARGQHHKTVAANEKLYGRSKRNFKRTKGIIGVPRGLPLNAYSKTYWGQLTSFKRDTISQVPPIGLDVIAQTMQKSCMQPAGNSGSGMPGPALNQPSRSNTLTGEANHGPSDSAAAGAMHVDC
ncbi:hypothetical protein PTTG_29723, partial [Puccinia triticina 1-1 BBBD Race 1]